MTLDLAALEKPITRILRAPGTDLSTISAKRVRKTLLEDPAYAHLGLTAGVLKTRRGEVDELIARTFQEVSRGPSERTQEDGDGGDDGEGEGEGVKEEEEADDEEDEKPRKKRKTARSVEESDAALARRLSTEINSRSRRGASLAAAGAGSSSSPRKGKRKPKKSAAAVESEDEEEGEGETKPKKRRAARGGFAKEYTLSEPLSAVLAVERMSRPQVVKQLWVYIRQNALQNPSNKREILCDDALRAVFSVDKIDMFKMNKVLGQHLHE